MSRIRFYWDSETRKLVPESEFLSKRWKSGYASPNISIFKSGYYHSLGRYCGSKADVKDACSRIEDRTGSRPVEIGDQQVKYAPNLRPYDA